MHDAAFVMWTNPYEVIPVSETMSEIDALVRAGVTLVAPAEPPANDPGP